MTQALTLLELNDMVSDVFDQSFTHAYWVSAEVSEVRAIWSVCRRTRTATPWSPRRAQQCGRASG